MNTTRLAGLAYVGPFPNWGMRESSDDAGGVEELVAATLSLPELSVWLRCWVGLAVQAGDSGGRCCTRNTCRDVAVDRRRR